MTDERSYKEQKKIKDKGVTWFQGIGPKGQ